MLNIGYFTSEKTDFVAKYVSGKLRFKGNGIAFWYGPRTTISKVPTIELQVPFIFQKELTADAQTLLVQGVVHLQLEPERVLDRYNFGVDPKTGNYRSQDVLEKIYTEVRNMLQVEVRELVHAKAFTDHMANTANLASSIETKKEQLVKLAEKSGLKVTHVFVTTIEPGDKDLVRALEAKQREMLLAEAEKALAERRKKQAESARDLKQYEAETELGLETKRADLIKVKSENLLLEATAEAEAAGKKLESYKDVDAPKLMSLSLLRLAEGGQVEHLHISPELLGALRSTF